MRNYFLKQLIFISSIPILLSCGLKSEKHTGKFPIAETPIDTVWFEYEDIDGIGYEEGVTRRDPSDIIKVDDTYYIWYTKVFASTKEGNTPLYNSGYYGTIWYATSQDGNSWTEKGQTLGPGKNGTFDSHAVFTPNILAYEGKYYLYYTGVKPTPGNSELIFENNSETDITAIGLAVSDSPSGPFLRKSDQPVLAISKDSSDFDSYRIDDAALNIRDGKVWLYYKGRSRKFGKQGPSHTQMGIAMADNPLGPYKKYDSPVMDRSHEVIIWNFNGGIASMACLDKSLNYASDGIHFSKVKDNLKDLPAAPGLYRPSISGNMDNIEKVNWGISMAYNNGHVYLRKFKMNY